jgi:hypothetical protein
MLWPAFGGSVTDNYGSKLIVPSHFHLASASKQAQGQSKYEKEALELLESYRSLSPKNMIPNEPNVEMIFSNTRRSSSGKTLRYDGSVAAFAIMLLQRAMESDELAGEPLHMKTFGTKLCRLAECRNDHEFGFISGMCGYERVSPMDYVLAGTSSV